MYNDILLKCILDLGRDTDTVVSVAQKDQRNLLWNNMDQDEFSY